MLNDQQAMQIVVDCIRAVSHIPNVNPVKPLDDAGISDNTRVNNMVTLIVNSSHIGVLSQRHRISETWFVSVGPGTIVNDVSDIVRDHATAIAANPMEDLASLMANHVAGHLSKQRKKEMK